MSFVQHNRPYTNLFIFIKNYHSIFENQGLNEIDKELLHILQFHELEVHTHRHSLWMIHLYISKVLKVYFQTIYLLA